MLIQWKTIDLAEWERRHIHAWFKELDFPYSVLGFDLDVSKFVPFLKQQDLSLYVSMIYAVCRTCNAIPAFKQRMRGDEVIEHERVHVNYTVPFGEESFGIKVVPYEPSFAEFYKAAQATPMLDPYSSLQKANGVRDHFVYMSSFHWAPFTHLVQPITKDSGSIPRIVWGKYTQKESGWVMPVSIQTHHSLVDGLHIAKFLAHLQGLLNEPEAVFV